jgi:MFS family permease
MTDDQAGDSSAPGKPAKLAGFNGTYWMCNAIEMWERLAYYTLRPVAPIYVMQADEPGGLHLTGDHKALIFLWWFIVQSLLPMVTGGFADRYGYRKTIAFSVTVNVIGYLMMAFLHSYYGFFGGVLVLAFGTAFFKPGLQGTLAHQLTKDSSSLGWGIFYWIVNVGSYIGHIISALVLVNHSAHDWRNLFLACAGFTCLNLLMLIKFPDVASGASKTENPLQVFVRTLKNIVEPRLVAWLLIMSCFWAMMYQLWDLQPNFIEDWVDSSMVAAHVPFDSWEELGPDGRLRVPQQILISLNALLIVLFIIPVSWAVRKMRTLEAMFFGMLGATAGVLVAGLTGNGWMLLLGIFCFSLGEMLTGPKKNEYLGLIAPPGKKGLYLGYVNIPVGIGGGFGNYLAGKLYARVGEKATLSLKYLMEQTPFGDGKAWDGSVKTLEEAAGVPRTEAFAKLQEVLGVDATSATRLLWDTYDPQYKVWIPFASIGILAAIALAVYGKLAKRWADMNA